jgi:seryl-tRNA synthetase
LSIRRIVIVDEPTTTETPPEQSPPASNPPEAPKGNDVSLEDLEKYRAEIRRELEEARSADKSERDELKEELKKVNDWIAEQRKAQEKKAESDDKHTMVVPPANITPQQAPQQPSTQPSSEHTTTEHGQDTRKRRLSWW